MYDQFFWSNGKLRIIPFIQILFTKDQSDGAWVGNPIISEQKEYYFVMLVMNLEIFRYSNDKTSMAQQKELLLVFNISSITACDQTVRKCRLQNY